MNNKIIVNIDREDILICGPYRSNSHCLLATALTRMKDNFQWVVADGFIAENGDIFKMSQENRFILVSNRYPNYENLRIELFKINS